MKGKSPLCEFIGLVLGVTLVFPLPSAAYIGPGGGLTAVGAFLALLAGIAVAILGFLWYPIRRLYRQWRSREIDDNENSSQ